MHKLNIIISRTDTLIGKTIRTICHANLNHTSVAFDNDFSTLYSFTRKFKPLFFTGCFCKEPIKRLNEIVVTEIEITDEEYEKIMEFIDTLKLHLRIYNYIEVVAILFNKEVHFKYNYTCSTFAAKILEQTNIKLNKSPRLYRPHELCDLLNDKIIYKGLATTL